MDTMNRYSPANDMCILKLNNFIGVYGWQVSIYRQKISCNFHMIDDQYQARTSVEE